MIGHRFKDRYPYFTLYIFYAKHLRAPEHNRDFNIPISKAGDPDGRLRSGLNGFVLERDFFKKVHDAGDVFFISDIDHDFKAGGMMAIGPVDYFASRDD